MLKRLFYLPLFFIIFTTTSIAQKETPWRLSISNHYSHSFFKHKSQNPIVAGSYGFGGEINYFFGKTDQPFQVGIGIAYYRIGQKEAYQWEMESADQVSHTHNAVLPISVVANWSANWYSGMQVALETPFLTSWSSIHYDAAGKEMVRYSGSSSPHLIINAGIGAGVLTGRRIHLKNGLTIFIEGKFKVFHLVNLFPDDESDIFYDHYPFLIGLNTGIYF